MALVVVGMEVSVEVGDTLATLKLVVLLGKVSVLGLGAVPQHIVSVWRWGGACSGCVGQRPQKRLVVAGCCLRRCQSLIGEISLFVAEVVKVAAVACPFLAFSFSLTFLVDPF